MFLSPFLKKSHLVCKSVNTVSPANNRLSVLVSFCHSSAYWRNVTFVFGFESVFLVDLISCRIFISFFSLYARIQHNREVRWSFCFFFTCKFSVCSFSVGVQFIAALTDYHLDGLKIIRFLMTETETVLMFNAQCSMLKFFCKLCWW